MRLGMEPESPNNSTPWVKGFSWLGAIGLILFTVGADEIAGLMCCGAIFSGLIGGVMFADAKQKAIREGSEVFNSTGYQLQQNADGTWEYVAPEEAVPQETISEQVTTTQTESPELTTQTVSTELTTQSESIEQVAKDEESAIDKKSLAAAAIGAVAGAGSLAAIKHQATEQIEIPEQIIEKVRQSGIQPDDLLKFADFNRDGLIDAAELTGAITATTGIAIPFTVLKAIIDKVDSDGDSALNRAELDLLWIEMGIPLTKVEQTLEEEIETTLEEITEQEIIPEEVVEESIEEDTPEVVEESDEEEGSEQPIEGTEFEEVELTEGIDTRLEETLVQLEEARLTSERNSIIEANRFDHRVTIRIERVDKTILGDPEYRGGLTFTGELDGGPYNALLEMPVAMTEQLSSFDKGDTIIAIAHLSKWKSGLKRAVLEGVEIIDS